MSDRLLDRLGAADPRRERRAYARRRSAGDRIADVVIHGVLLALLALTAAPFYYMLVVSFARFEDVAGGAFYLIPKSIDFASYALILEDDTMLRAFLVSTAVTVIGTGVSMLITTSAGYALSKKGLPGRNAIFTYVIITMFFSGGLIPLYLVMQDLGFVDSYLVMIVPLALNTFFLILMKNYFLTIPESLEESAKIDGANDILIMFRIVIPIAAPIMATMSLFYAVAYWNDWWFPMLFLQDPDKYPLQLLLRRIVIEQEMANRLDRVSVTLGRHYYRLSVQMATVAIATLPILLVYPFVQKYFARGIMVGAIKA